MKVSVVGLEGFVVGKKNLPDERLDRLKEILHSPKVTYIKIDFSDASELKSADSILVEEAKKLDLILEDIETAENRISQEKDNAKLELLNRIKAFLEQENLISEFNLSDEEKKILLNYNFITIRPIIIAGAEDLSNLPKLINRVYQESGFISFFTSNEKELRAWQAKSGTTAHEAAGLIHSDIQRGFIKAEVIRSEDIIKSGGLGVAKTNNLMKLEDKEYVVKDGDWMNFRFNV